MLQAAEVERLLGPIKKCNFMDVVGNIREVCDTFDQEASVGGSFRDELHLLL
jgi:hypothetical protein